MRCVFVVSAMCICSECDVYFVIRNDVNRVVNNTESTNGVGVRPVLIAARRQGGFLCAWVSEDMEWPAIDDVNVEGLEVSEETVIATGGGPILEESRDMDNFVNDI